MGVIQSGINQLIGTAAITARLSPDFETRQELAALEKTKAQAQLQKTYSIEAIQLNAGNPDAKQHWEEMKKRNERLSEVSEKIFNISPTHENYQSMIEAQKKLKSMSKLGNLLYGQERAQQKAAEQLQQKENLNKFREQISSDSDVQDTINILKGKDVPTQAELDLDKKILKALPNFNEFGESAKQQIREQFKEGGNK